MKKEKSSDIKKQVKITSSKFSLKQFLLTFFVLCFFALTQSQIMSSFFNIKSLTKEWFYFLSIALFWAMIAFIYILVQRKQIKHTFGEPLQKLCEATQLVSEGNFSVRLEANHSQNEYDYIDVTYNNFNRMVQELSSIETLKTSFIADVSHELKTPLAVIQNYGTMLQSPTITDVERVECADTIVEATQNLTTLITNILKLNKLENQSILPEKKEYDLCTQLSDSVLMFVNQLEDKNIELIANIDDHCKITSDETMLSIVWQNLLSNAIKFSDFGSSIILTQFQTDDFISVSVTDTGCGMSEKTKKHIFDKFYQGDTSHSGEGNGLGLALCAKVIVLLDGRICVQSEVGKGTVFTVKLKKIQ